MTATLPGQFTHVIRSIENIWEKWKAFVGAKGYILTFVSS